MARGNPLWRNEFVELEVSYADKIVLVRRTAAPFTRLGDIEATTEALARALPTERRKQHGVLVDMRLAPVRTDPSLEPAFERYRREVERGFERAVAPSRRRGRYCATLRLRSESNQKGLRPRVDPLRLLEAALAERHDERIAIAG